MVLADSLHTSVALDLSLILHSELDAPKLPRGCDPLGQPLPRAPAKCRVMVHPGIVETLCVDGMLDEY